MIEEEDKINCELFQTQLSYEKIDNIWKAFREAGNSLQGRITKSSFKKIMSRMATYPQRFLQRLFQRFRIEAFNQSKPEKTEKQKEIQLQDLVLGLAVLSRLCFLDKVKFIFYLTDLDQDGCLSVEQIQNMIQRIEKIFRKQNSSAKVESSSILLELASKKANRNFRQVLSLLQRQNSDFNQEDGGLITGDQFLEALKQSRDLYREEKFIPLNLSLTEVIKNISIEPSIRITETSKNIFCEMRKEIHNIMQPKTQKETIIKYSGNVQILRNDGTIQQLPKFQKNIQKKPHKIINKAKLYVNQKGHSSQEMKQFNEQKTTEQNLQNYKEKLKKMKQTQNDPRLDIRFDHVIKR